MSSEAFSPDTEIVLLLCGRFGGERQEPFSPLSAREYGDFAKWLKSVGLRPADLLMAPGQEQLANVHDAKLERKRVDFLLGRGTALALAMERWSRGGLWVISRGDPDFPKRLKRHLKHAAPPLLYGAGDKGLLDEGGLAIIGSRDATEGALEFTRAIGSKCARESLNVVSGGARGVDSAAMQGATDAGGMAIGVLASDLLKSSLNRQNRLGLQEGRLVLISPFYPEAGFNGGNAMTRNKYIYTLADQALVIDSALGSGGTWEGALEDLKQGWVPLYVRTPGEGAGNAALVEKGGLPFRLNENASEPLAAFFAQSQLAKPVSELNLVSPQQDLLSVDEAEPPAKSSEDTQVSNVSLEITSGAHESATEVVPETDKLRASEERSIPLESEGVPGETVAKPVVDTLDMYFDFLAKLARVLGERPLSEDELTTLLCLGKSQTKVWLKRATDDAVLKKLKNPVRYALHPQSSLC